MLVALALTAGSAGAQQQTVIYPGSTGTNLLSRLQQGYSPKSGLNYGTARNQLYADVWVTNNTLECQYTGLTISMAGNGEPKDIAFGKGINTEHVYPQSKGAEGDARADMHHLYPTQIDVNSDRGSLPFGEIPDAQTLTWYRLKEELRTVPPANVRDEYSEGTTAAFEPREKIKGDIARAVFYFWSIHRARAQREDATFFGKMRADLCTWHETDPVDAAEATRSRKIATYQDNENPFVLDCSLPQRLAYCPNLSQACRDLTPVVQLSRKPSVEAFPNPLGEVLQVEGIPGGSSLRLLDALGREVAAWTAADFGRAGAGGATLTWVVPSDLPVGMYFLHVGASGEVVRLVKR